MIVYLKPYQTLIWLPFVENRVYNIFNLYQYIIGSLFLRYSQYYLHKAQLTRFVSLNSSYLFKSFKTLHSLLIYRFHILRIRIDKRIDTYFYFLFFRVKRHIKPYLFIMQMISTCWGISK